MAKKTPPAKTAPEATATATFVAPERVAPENRRGASTVDYPIARTWVMCLNMTEENGGTPPARRDLNKAGQEMGVAYYTARTQVQAYLKWFNEGSVGATPRGVVIDG